MSDAPLGVGGSPSGTDLELLLTFLREVRGFVAAGLDCESQWRQIERRMQAVGAADVRGYVDHLEAQPDEVDKLLGVVLGHEASFFDDPTTWEHVAEHVVPELVDQVTTERPVRIWSAGCGTGQEVYTLTMLLAAAFGGDVPADLVSVFATDRDAKAVAVARRGRYTADEVARVPMPLLQRYFDTSTSRDGASFSVAETLRRRVTFGRHDLTVHAAIRRVDLLLCRHTLVYLDGQRRRDVLDQFHDSLTSSGLLVLGSAEAPLDERSSFEDVGGPPNVVRPIRRRRIVGDDSPRSPDATSDFAALSELAFAVGPIPRTVVDDRSVLVLANDAARALLGLSEHDLGRPIDQLQLSSNPVELLTPVRTAMATKRVLTLGVVPFVDRHGVTSQLEVTITPLAESSDAAVLGAVVAFLDVTAATALTIQLATANRELEQVYDELELTNAEVRSTNDEFETMNDELQAITDELARRTRSLRERSVELDAARLDSRAGTASGSALVAVDGDLRVLTWSSGAQVLWGVDSNTAVGTPLAELGIGLMSELDAPIRSVLDGHIDEQTLDLTAPDGSGAPRRFRAGCSPLRSPSGGVAGVVLLIEPSLANLSGG